MVWGHQFVYSLLSFFFLKEVIYDWCCLRWTKHWCCKLLILMNKNKINVIVSRDKNIRLIKSYTARGLLSFKTREVQKKHFPNWNFKSRSFCAKCIKSQLKIRRKAEFQLRKKRPMSRSSDITELDRYSFLQLYNKILNKFTCSERYRRIQELLCYNLKSISIQALQFLFW